MAWKAKIQQVQNNPVFSDSITVQVSYTDDQDDTRAFTKDYQLISQNFADIGSFDALIESQLQTLLRFDNMVEIIKQRVGAADQIDMQREPADVLRDVAVAPSIIEKEDLGDEDLQVSEVTATPDLSDLPEDQQPSGVKPGIKPAKG